MTDLEQRIRQVLSDDAQQAPRVERAPETIRPRVRQRQTFTGLVAGLTVLVVSVASVAAIRTFSPSRGSLPVGPPTATVTGRPPTGGFALSPVFDGAIQGVDFRLSMGVVPGGGAVAATISIRARDTDPWERAGTYAFALDRPIDGATYTGPLVGGQHEVVTFGIVRPGTAAVRGDYASGGFRVAWQSFVPIRMDGRTVGFAWADWSFFDPGTATVRALDRSGATLGTAEVSQAPPGAPPAGAAQANVVTRFETDGVPWRLLMTWGDGPLGQSVLEIRTGDGTWTPIASSPLTLEGGFSFAAANLPSDPSAVCRPTVLWGVYDPAVVSEIRLDGGPFDHGTGSGNPAFGGGTLFFRTKLCNVDPGIHHLAGYDANGDLVTAQVPIVPMDTPA